MEITEMEVAGRLLLGAPLGGGIGFERQTYGRFPGGTMTYRFTIATQHRNSERRIVDALAGNPGVRRVTVHA